VLSRTRAASPTEDLSPSVVGVIDEFAAALPVKLDGGLIFAPPPGARVERIYNWPADSSDDGLYEPMGLDEEQLLLGGQRPDGSWWYELAGHSSDGACYATIQGGSFDAGDSVRFSSGLRLPKAPGFNVQGEGRVLGDDAGFPGHNGDNICIDKQGRAVWFERFIGR
jgi:hypothetical protein